jgi:hypothetical protein
VAGTNVTGLQGFEVLEGAEFVGHFLVSVGWVFCDGGVLWLLYVEAGKEFRLGNCSDVKEISRDMRGIAMDVSGTNRR